MCPRFKRMRAAAFRAVARPSWPAKLEPVLRYETYSFVKDLAVATGEPLNPYRPLQRITMNLSFSLTYGVRFESPDDPFYKAYLSEVVAVSRVRTATKMWVNFIPVLKWWPDTVKKIKSAKRTQERRVELLQELLDNLTVAQEKGENVECIAADLTKDAEAKLSRGKFREVNSN